MNRRELLGLAAGAGLAAVARPSAAQTPLYTVRVGTFVSESTAGAFYAQDAGFFTKHGIAMTVTPATGGAAVAAAIVGGDLDIGESDVITVALARDRGLPFVLFAPGVLHSNAAPTLAIVTKDPALKIGKDFNGKTMACNVARGFGALITNVWIDNNGGDSKTVKWVELPFPSLSAALQRGTIDGYTAPEPFVSAGVRDGGHIVLLEKNPVAPVILQGGWFASKDWIAKNPGAAKAFADSIREADDWANKNPRAAAEILSKYSKVPLAVIESVQMRGQYQTRLEPATVTPLIAAALKYGYISKNIPVSDLIVNL